MLKNKYKYRKQINMKDCGVATLATVLDNYGTYHSLIERKGGLFLGSNKIIDLTPKIRKFLNFLFLFLIIANIIMDLYFVGKIDYKNVVWMTITIFFYKQNKINEATYHKLVSGPFFF